MTDSITLTRPDDWHLHLRDGALMQQVVPASARRFGRAIVMPNLTPPVTTTAEALAYRERILGACPPGSAFTPLMTLYLTDNTTPAMIREAAAQGIIACKLYPAGATTNSDSGVTDVRNIQATLDTMAEEGILLLVHGEVTQAEIDIFDREKSFIDNVLEPLLERLPELRVVMEHITTADAAAFVGSRERNLGATITPSTCCSIATTCWWAVSARTSTACPSLSVRVISRRCRRWPSVVTRVSSWARIRPP